MFVANFNPIACSIFGLKIYWYGLGYIISLVIALYYSNYLLKLPKLWSHNLPPLNWEQLNQFVLYAAYGIIIGGRLGDILFWEPSFFYNHPQEIFAIWHGGMSFHGGLLGVIIAAIVFCYKNKIHLLTIFDLSCTAAPIGIFIVRICNFINSELYGKATQAPWGVIFPQIDNLPRHPSQLYEAALEGILLFLILNLLTFKLKAFKKPGFISAIFCILYSLGRIISEIYRHPDPAPQWFSQLFDVNIFSFGMFLCLPMLIIGVILIMISRRQCHLKPKS